MAAAGSTAFRREWRHSLRHGGRALLPGVANDRDVPYTL